PATASSAQVAPAPPPSFLSSCPVPSGLSPSGIGNRDRQRHPFKRQRAQGAQTGSTPPKTSSRQAATISEHHLTRLLSVGRSPTVACESHSCPWKRWPTTNLPRFCRHCLQPQNQTYKFMGRSMKLLPSSRPKLTLLILATVLTASAPCAHAQKTFDLPTYRE